MLSFKTLLAAAAVLSVALPPATALAEPVNDRRANALALAGTGGSHSGNTSSATFTGSEEQDKLGTGTHSVWYRWTAPKAGLLTLTTDAAFDAVLNTYADATTCCRWRSNDDDGDGKNPLVTIYVNAGQTYLISVDGYSQGEHGNYTISATFDDTPPPPSNDAFLTPEPLVSAMETGAPMALQFATRQWIAGEPDHRGLGGTRSLWFKWTAPEDGGVNIDVGCSSTSTFMAHHPILAAYTGDQLPTLTPVDATKLYDNDSCDDDFVQFQAVEGTTYKFAVDALPETPLGAAYLDVDQDITDPTIEFPTQTVYGPNSEIVFQTSSDAWRTYCKLDGGQEIACGSKLKLQNAAADGHKLEARTTDHHGNTSPWTEFEFTVDGEGPETNITAGPGPTTNETSSKIAFSSPDPVAKFECRMGGSGSFASCTSPYTTSTRYNGSSGEFEVRAIDQWGNRDASPATRNWMVDTQAPSVFLVGNYPVEPVGQPLTWAFKSDDPAATFACSLDNAPYAPCTSPFTAAGVGHATTRNLLVRATDPAGNSAARGLSGHQTKPFVGATSVPQTPPATQAPVRGAGVTGTGLGVTGTGTARTHTVGGGPRITLVRAARSVSRRTLSRRGLAVTVGCATPCAAQVELRARGRLLARGSGRGTVRVKPVRGAARRIGRLRPGTRLTLVATIPGASAWRATVRVARPR